MKLDLLKVLKHFVVEHDRLYRRHRDGTVREITLIDRGRLAAMLDGVRVYGPDIAYACIYRVVPMFPIIQVDGDPHNMAENNLMPVRTKRLRYRAVLVAGGWRHPLDRMTFRDEQTCHADWVRHARNFYHRDKPYVRQLEDEAQGRKPVVEKRVVIVRRVYGGKRREGRPEPVEGRSWHWWQDSWLSLPDPVHESDDWMVRATVVAASPEAVFVYDPVAQRTVSVI